MREKAASAYWFYILGIIMGILAKVCFLWLADMHIGIEPARSWQLTFPVVGFVLCFGATGVFATPGHRRLLVSKGQTTDFGCTHADGG